MARIGAPPAQREERRENVYAPRLARVLEARPEIAPGPTSRAVVTLSVERAGLAWRPGQFFQLGVFGAGEVPISISSPPSLPATLLFTVRAAGVVSTMLTQRRAGDLVSLRGPAGNGFPLEHHRGRDVLFVAGGIGLAPLRGLLWEMLLQRESFGRIIVLHGARTPQDLLYPWQYAEWKDRGVELHLSVDMGDGTWERGEDPPRVVGFITTLFTRLSLDPVRTVAFVCGPPVMIRVTCTHLTNNQHIPPARCYATLERHMKCGIGKCGHCIVADRYICMDGPVFRYDELSALTRVEAPW
jgi:sulfhydrogenase subunit gamma (sulfur reductase)